MKTHSHTYNTRLVTRAFGAFFALACLPAFAGFIDSFNNKTGWKDTLNGGSASVAGGVFTITSAAAPGLTASIKTNVTVLTTSSNTLELRVLVNNIAPGSPGNNGNAVLGWVPTGGALLANGYALVVGATNIQIYKDSTALYGTNLAAPLQTNNLVIVLRMTSSNIPESGDVTSSNIKGSVYQNANGRDTLLWEYVATDPGSFELGAGNPALGSLNSPSGAASVIKFDDLQSYDVTYFAPATSTLLDNMNSAHSSAYSDFLQAGPFATITQPGSDGSMAMNIALPSVVNVFLMGTKLNSPTFRIADGVRIEARVKVVDQRCITLPDDDPLSGIAIFGYFPDPGNTDFSTLRGYFLVAGSMYKDNPFNAAPRTAVAKDAGYVFGGKSAAQFWVDAGFYPTHEKIIGQYVSTNVEFIQIFTGEGNNIRIEQRVEDLSKGFNDPARIVYQISQLDANFASTPAYVNADGTFALINYQSGSNNNKEPNYVKWDNLVIGQTTPITPSPNITTNFPASGAAFAGTNTVTFKATHPSAVPTNNMVLTLNGIRYTNGTPFNGGFCKVSSSQAGFQTNMTLLMTNLPPDTFFSGTISATSDGGKNTTVLYSFDTFRDDGTHSKVIESEEYNFNGGQYIDPSVTIVEGNTLACSGVGPGYTGCAYNGQLGTAEVDFHTDQAGIAPLDGERIFRTDDAIRTLNSGDTPRAKYANPGGIAAGYYEVIVGGQDREMHNGDWVNYTRLNPAGTYNAFLRMSTYSGGSPLLLRQSQVSLSRVTSDPSQTDQTTSLLGAFYQLSDAAGDTGADLQRTVPMTDSSGRLLTFRLPAPPSTLRVNQDFVHTSDGQVAENYLVLIPVPDPGTLRPFVSSVSPPANSITRIGNASTEATQATIANRDTTVDTTKIAFKMNGTTVAVTVTPTASGATVAWPPSATPATPIISNTLSYADSQNVTQVVTWSYSYPFLYASNSFPVGFLSARGITNRTAWTFNDGNTLGDSLARGEQQLSIPPQIPLDTYFEGNISMMNWDDNECAAATLPPGVTCVPGLETGGPYDNIACESSGYMHLTAGLHRWVITSDDGFQIRSGSTVEDLNATTLGFSDGSTFSGTFDFNVEAEGLYPMRSLWYENGGYADYHVSSRDISGGGNPDAVVNDPGNPAGVVEVFLPTQPDVLLYGSSSVLGPYTLLSSATIDTVNKQITVAISGTRQFYRISSTTAATITQVKKVGSNIVVTYTK